MPITALLVEYDGTKFYGFQKQKNPSILTVQGSLEQSLEIILKEKIKLFTAGRTDTGVHSKGLILSFSYNKQIENYYKHILSLNAISNPNLSVLAACEMPDNFHARFSCSEREYEYLLLNTEFPHPLLKNKAYWYKNKLNKELFQNLANQLEGIHDFSSFTKKESLKTYESTIRKISNFKIIEDTEIKGLYRIRIKGTGFLHNMVRICIGTILDIARGKIKKNLLEVIESKEREKAGITLPPYGLYFKRAHYKDFPQIDELYNKIYT